MNPAARQLPTGVWRTGVAAMLLAALLIAPLSSHAGPLRDRLAERPPTNGKPELTNLVYGPFPQQRLDVYLPPAHAQRPQGRPVLFVVHGGGWKRGDKSSATLVEHKLAHWSEQGVVMVSVNYRMRPEVDPLVQAQDVAKALAHVQAHAHEWGADATRIVAMGHSAGAHLVSLLASAPELVHASGALPVRGTVALDSAAFNVPAIMNAAHFPLYDDAFGTDPALWQAASPLHRLAQAGPPLMAVCSTQRKVACEQAHAYQTHAQKLGMRVEVLGQDLSHRDINDRLGLPGAYTDAVDAFIRSLVFR
jgi:arylformamidase